MGASVIVPRLRLIASPANALSSFEGKERVVRSVGVTMRAVRSGCLPSWQGFAAEDVLSVRDCFKVGRIGAASSPAQVVNDELLGDNSMVDLVGDAVRGHMAPPATVLFELSQYRIAVRRDLTRPQPAPSIDGDCVFPEAILNRSAAAGFHLSIVNQKAGV
jgi:hypothetical protein